MRKRLQEKTAENKKVKAKTENESKREVKKKAARWVAGDR